MNSKPKAISRAIPKKITLWTGSWLNVCQSDVVTRRLLSFGLGSFRPCDQATWTARWPRWIIAWASLPQFILEVLVRHICWCKLRAWRVEAPPEPRPGAERTRSRFPPTHRSAASRSEDVCCVPARPSPAIPMNVKEIVLGLGPQKSLWSVAHLAESQLRPRPPSCGTRKVIAQAQGIELEAARPTYEGEFNSFTVRLRNPSRGRSRNASRLLPPLRHSVRGRREGQRLRNPLPRRFGRPVDAGAGPGDLRRPLDQAEDPRGLESPGQGLSGRPDQSGGPVRLMIKFNASDVHLYSGLDAGLPGR